MFEKILIATDGSKHSEKAAEKALEMARLTGGKVTALYVSDVSNYFAPVDMSYNIADETIGGMRNLVLKDGEAAVKRVEEMAKEAGVPFESKIIEGNPAEDIMKFAEESKEDLIVMGGIGRTGLEKFLLGSVAEKVVRNSRVPVMVVRGV
ncbi:MAG TPA: universal stress protein [Methanotrichaceae archaeon]|nr:universal stress protein [Methanotrichaceae archaeon]